MSALPVTSRRLSGVNASVVMSPSWLNALSSVAVSTCQTRTVLAGLGKAASWASGENTRVGATVRGMIPFADFGKPDTGAIGFETSAALPRRTRSLPLASSHADTVPSSFSHAATRPSGASAMLPVPSGAGRNRVRRSLPVAVSQSRSVAMLPAGSSLAFARLSNGTGGKWPTSVLPSELKARLKPTMLARPMTIRFCGSSGTGSVMV